jgi:NitT/TauT family transport system ATP-binding protein
MGKTALMTGEFMTGIGKISIEDVSFSYKEKPVFKNLNMEISNNETAAILGPSGCGKTTLLRLMAGLLKPAAGQVHAGACGMVFQEPRLIPWKTALENTALVFSGIFNEKEAHDRARHFLSLVNLENKALSLPRELSGGEQQRVNLARAFAFPAENLLMDEPFQSLDIPLRIQLMELTLSLLSQSPRLTVLVSHDPREALYLAKRIIVLGAPPEGIIYDEPFDNGGESRGWASHGEYEQKLIELLKQRVLPQENPSFQWTTRFSGDRLN